MAASSHRLESVISSEKRKNHFVQIPLFLFLVSCFVLFYLAAHFSRILLDQNRDDYLISLRENSTIGCSSFSQLSNNILIVGDSHSYAGFDFYRLGELAQTQKISACTMGGFYFPSLIELLEKIKSSKIYPANIIFGLSLRQFTTGADMEKQLDEHHKLISAIGSSEQNVFSRIKDNFELGLNNWISPKALKQVRQKSLATWQPIITSLDVTKVDHLFENLNHPAKQNWQKYIGQIEFLKSNSQNLVQFCQIIKSTGIKLFLVDIPESPYLRKRYSPTQLELYDGIVSQLSKCAQAVVRMTYQEWGIDNRHFLNRSLSDKWQFEELDRDLNEASSEAKSLAFDLDHLNLVGAQIVTEKTFQMIGKELNYAF